MNNIAKAFVAAKREFAPALKTSTNPHFRSKYADLAGCLEAVNEALLNHGIAIYQETSEDATGVTVETVFLHESGETLRGGKLHVPASKQDAQGYGSALTYARRYSLQAACGIAPEDDDGNAASRKSAATEPKTVLIHTPNGNARYEVPPEELLYLEELAQETTELCKVNPKEAYALVASKKLDEPQHKAFWTYLDSKTKSALKAAK